MRIILGLQALFGWNKITKNQIRIDELIKNKFLKDVRFQSFIISF